MKDIYDIILAKLNQDRKRFNEEINDIVDDEFMSEYEKARYSRVLGKKQYCDDLIEFFEEASRFIN